MPFDVAQVDRLLTTPRTVRKKLDFDREVGNDLLQEKVALQDLRGIAADLCARSAVEGVHAGPDRSAGIAGFASGDFAGERQPLF